MRDDYPSSVRRLSALSRHVASMAILPQVNNDFTISDHILMELVEERSRASFPTQAMTHYIDRGAHRTNCKEQIMNIMENTPALHMSPSFYDLSTDEMRESTFQKVKAIHAIFSEYGSSDEHREAIIEVSSMYDLSMWVRNGVHLGLFMETIASQASQEQRSEWLPPTLMHAWYGAFAMTELGHGSYTRGLETTATYDSSTEEFIIHTPTDTATKWWIGAVADTATHAVVYAQLNIYGKDYGVQSFLVPLRIQGTSTPCPGVIIGDCGDKMGLNGVDNGWLQFKHVRVPRFNMLAKYAQVTSDGTFVRTSRQNNNTEGEATPSSKNEFAYAALIRTRGQLVMLSMGVLKKALTIAIRYCAVRRQGTQVSSIDNHTETKLLDYQTHQLRLMPLLAKAYAFGALSSHLSQLLETLHRASSSTQNNSADTTTALKLDIANIHGTMAGLKAFMTWNTLAAIDICRQCCGGNGFSSYAGFSTLLKDYSVFVTFEGDNTVMAQQTATYLMRQAHLVLLQGVSSVSYLNNPPVSAKWTVNNKSELADTQKLKELLDFYSYTRVFQVAKKLPEQWSPQEWNAVQGELVETARVHVFVTVAYNFLNTIQFLRDNNTDPDAFQIVPVLKQLCDLYIFDEVSTQCGFLLQHGYLSAEQTQWLHDAKLLRCQEIRYDSVALVDAFNVSDFLLNSTLGRSDGNIYQNMLDVATSKTSVAPYRETVIQPFLDAMSDA